MNLEQNSPKSAGSGNRLIGLLVAIVVVLVAIALFIVLSQGVALRSERDDRSLELEKEQKEAEEFSKLIPSVSTSDMEKEQKEVEESSKLIPPVSASDMKKELEELEEFSKLIN